MSHPSGLPRRLAAELLGSAGLLIAVVGSGIMAERLAAGNLALALLVNSLATGAALVAIILALGSISGPHLNPAVSLVMAWGGRLAWRDAGFYASVQVAGAVAGVVVAHAMFAEPLVAPGSQLRTGAGQWLGELVATAGLITVILGCTGARSRDAAFAVGAYITGAYWFTSSTAFANPAATVARALTDTFAGIRPADVPAFLVAQAAGAIAAAMLSGWMMPASANSVERTRDAEER